MIAHGAGGFSGESAVPIIGMQSVTNLDVLDSMFRMMEEAAVAKQREVGFSHRRRIARHNGELGGNFGAIPADDFFDESDRLFALRENA